MSATDESTTNQCSGQISGITASLPLIHSLSLGLMFVWGRIIRRPVSLALGARRLLARLAWASKARNALLDG